jgi:prepilin-type N-terminal cleavage/methylation domain-containing protein
MRNLKSEMRNALKGFTIIELMISTAILAILIITGASIYTNFYNSVKNLQASNMVYEEARFTMERIASEIRNSTVDYEEYYNQAANYAGDPHIDNIYGENYCQYSRQFYGPGPDGKFGTYDDESLGVRKAGSPSPIPSIIQDKLFLINSSGNHRTYIKKIVNSDGLGKVGLLKLTGEDYGLDHLNSDAMNNSTCLPDSGERDGLIDTWLCDKGFKCTQQPAGTPPCNGFYDIISDDPAHPETSSFLNITPTSIDIQELKFLITPMDDPYKAYNDPSVQIQPNITIKLIARASPEIAGAFKGKIADIVLESTVSSRTYNEITTSCNLQECIDGDKRDCPKKPCPTTGSCDATQVTCAQGVWPICTDQDYMDSVEALKYLTPDGRPGGIFASLGVSNPLNTYYEADNEVGSCNSTNFPDPTTGPGDIIKCKQERCTDGFDNDGNGVADNKDPACLWVLCNNGIWDIGVEDCLDVGGDCSFIRPKESVETNCSDGYDNDCNYRTDASGKWVEGTGADEFDSNCVKTFCSDGQKTVGPSDPRNGLFLKKTYEPKNYLLGATVADQTPDLSEVCTDIGGICSGETSTVTIPGNPSTSKDITQALQPPGSEKGDYCYDRLDNDCSGKADELDPSCKTTICGNAVTDNQLAPTDYTPADYLKGYSNPLGLLPSDNNEQCTDTGGVCGATVSENTYELCTNGKDDDCDGKADGTLSAILSGKADSNCCPDPDGDGFFAPNPGLGGPMCNPPDSNVTTGFPPNGLIDCNPLDPSIHPGAPEVCDDAVYQAGPLVPPPLVGQPIDNNCSGLNHAPNGAMLGSWDHNDPSCCIDADHDGYGIPSAGIYWDGTPNGDCRHSGNPTDPGYKKFDSDDSNPNINPGITEVCDGIDNNSDGKIDENPATGLIPWTQACYTGAPATRNVGVCKDGTQTCSAGSWSSCAGEVTPSPEVCDGLDNNCDGNIDEGVTTTFYKDGDSDGFGDPANSTQACSQPAGYVTNNTDCNDSDPSIHANCP